MTIKPPKVRCAIYTRKSSEEGLEQDFNSLAAQREACEAYIASQKHAGWSLFARDYDDGGFSGGTLERPGLRQLLEDIRSGEVQVVVVYKVDRLTRSLADFAKIVDVMDAAGASFVSVTQQFNTTTSMGRLTLNVLLSFAQFEREVTGERIRDKIAASKKKGMWMGGNPPLGYDIVERKLVVNPDEAETVRLIFTLYRDLGSVRLLLSALNERGVVGKSRTLSDGRVLGGKPFARGGLYKLLQNRIYRGEIVHRGQAYPGQHEAIIDDTLWGTVEQQLADNRLGSSERMTAKQPSPLAGYLFDETGTPMASTHATKAGKRYRYYISNPATAGSARRNRIPAKELEKLVLDRITDFLTDRPSLISSIAEIGPSLETIEAVIDASSTLSQQPSIKIVQTLAPRICVLSDRIEITLSPARVIKIAGAAIETSDTEDIVLHFEATLKRSGIGKKLIVAKDDGTRTVDNGLVRLVAQAYRIRKRIDDDPTLTVQQAASPEGYVSSYGSRLLRLGFLAPDIVAAILDGRQPDDLSTSKLIGMTDLPLDWAEQRQVLGFA